LLLKPGMTANVTIVTARRDQALRVPVDALRFAPAGQPKASFESDSGHPRNSRVWIPDGGGVTPVSISTGLDDGRWVEVLSGPIHPGDQVVTGEKRTESKSSYGSPPRFPH
jgi:HlyD family secretion protein